MKRKGRITQVHMSVKVDEHLMPFIDKQKNKNRMVNIAIEEYMQREEVKDGK